MVNKQKNTPSGGVRGMLYHALYTIFLMGGSPTYTSIIPPLNGQATNYWSSCETTLFFIFSSLPKFNVLIFFFCKTSLSNSSYDNCIKKLNQACAYLCIEVSLYHVA